jgi:hypothetical protein
MGNSASAQTSAMQSISTLVRTWLAAKPTTMPERENRRKKALPSEPNWVLLRPRSRMMGTLARPTTALSA